MNKEKNTIKKQDLYNSLDKLYNIYGTDELIKEKMIPKLMWFSMEKLCILFS